MIAEEFGLGRSDVWAVVVDLRKRSTLFIILSPIILSLCHSLSDAGLFDRMIWDRMMVLRFDR